jgi:hypothetical protein
MVNETYVPGRHPVKSSVREGGSASQNGMRRAVEREGARERHTEREEEERRTSRIFGRKRNGVRLGGKNVGINVEVERRKMVSWCTRMPQTKGKAWLYNGDEHSMTWR